MISTLEPDRGYMGDRCRGASLGRADTRNDTETNQRFYLQQVQRDSQGYDSGGAYWGVGGLLWRFQSEDGQESGFLWLEKQRRNELWDAELRLCGGSHDEAYRRHPRRLSAWLDRETAKAQVRDTYPNARFFR